MNVSVSSQQITANVAGSAVSATVQRSGAVSATIAGGFGPPGPAGIAGRLADLEDVQISNAATGDLLRRDAGKWKNYAERGLTLDGGNF